MKRKRKISFSVVVVIAFILSFTTGIVYGKSILYKEHQQRLELKNIK